MGRIGSALLVLLSAAPALADVEFSMLADRTKVGVQDVLRVDIVVGNAPNDAQVQFPAPNGFEVLQRNESTEMSYSVGAGGAGMIKQVRRYTLSMRAVRTGTLTIPAAVLEAGGKRYTTAPLTIEVVKGSVDPEPSARQRRRAQNPFGIPPGMFPPGFGFPGGDDEDDPFSGIFPQPAIPRGDSDIFLRMSVDKPEAWVGEQVIITLLLYSRVDLSSVDSVTMPKLEGFWSQDMKTPSQLTPERKDVEGVPYNVFVLRKKVLFPLRPGDFTIESCEADLTSGLMWAGHRLHRKSNEVKLKVKALPPPGKANAIGQWRLSAQLSQTHVSLGDPVTLKLVLEGKGNLEAVQLPKLDVPAAIKAFDPEVKDQSNLTHNAFSGTRTVEYTLVPQQTGEFTVPGVTLEYFDPERSRYTETRTDPFTLTVTPSPTGQTVAPVPGPVAAQTPDVKNQLVGGGLKQLRHSAQFSSASAPVWSRPWFLPLTGAPLALSVAFALLGALRSSLGRQTPESLKKKQAKAARKRLASAQKLLGSGATTEFYGEVERALTSFLEAKLGVAVTGMTRVELGTRLAARGIPDAEKARLLAVYERCDLGRYAPGMGEASARQAALDDAAAAMEAFP